MIRALLAGALLLGSTGCAGRALATHTAPGGNLLALTARQAERDDRAAERQRRVKPLAVLIERDGIRALDVDTATERWSSNIEAEAHPAANTNAIFVPLSGHRLAALDRHSGELMWRIELPGEALSGIAANASTVVVTAVSYTHLTLPTTPYV